MLTTLSQKLHLYTTNLFCQIRLAGNVIAASICGNIFFPVKEALFLLQAYVPQATCKEVGWVDDRHTWPWTLTLQAGILHLEFPHLVRIWQQKHFG